MERLNELLNKTNPSKPEAKELRNLFNNLYGIRYGGCMCSMDERKELQEQIKKYLKENE